MSIDLEKIYGEPEKETPSDKWNPDCHIDGCHAVPTVEVIVHGIPKEEGNIVQYCKPHADIWIKAGFKFIRERKVKEPTIDFISQEEFGSGSLMVKIVEEMARANGSKTDKVYPKGTRVIIQEP